MNKITHENYNFSAIYKITNLINGKIYIGSALNLRRRFISYEAEVKNPNKNRGIIRAIRKYGFNNLEFSVLEKIDNSALLIEREQFWLDQLKPFGRNGYNMAKFAGSNLGVPLSEETKAKISAKSMGRIVSEETKVKLRQSSGRRLAKALIAWQEPVYKIEPKTLKILKKYESITQADKENGFSNSVLKTCQSCNRRKSGGFHFCYVEDYHSGKFNPVEINYCAPYHERTRKIQQIGKDDQIIAVWKSASMIEKSLGFNRKIISKSCKNKNENYGYYWRFVNE
jgi:group I intron endonuclease